MKYYKKKLPLSFHLHIVFSMKPMSQINFIFISQKMKYNLHQNYKQGTKENKKDETTTLIIRKYVFRKKVASIYSS